VFSLVPRCHGLCGSQKVDVHLRGNREALVFGHLQPSIPRQRVNELPPGISPTIFPYSRFWKSVTRRVPATTQEASRFRKETRRCAIKTSPRTARGH
jgi:hypothetical protein